MKSVSIPLKGLMPITFSSPRAQLEVPVVHFMMSNEFPYFLFVNPKFHLPKFFIIASSPGMHTFFCLWRVNNKLPQGET